MSTNLQQKPSPVDKSTSTKTRVGQNGNISTASFPGEKFTDKGQHIQVAVRIRPLNENERRHGTVPMVTANSSKREVLVREKVNTNATKTFTYDKVFGPNCSQIEVYREVVVPVLQEVLMGYNCTIFAYGQTGTGKTFTMEGERTQEHVLSHATWESDPLAGIIPRTLHHLFETLTKQEGDFTIRVSFIELYNEELFDLLGADDASSLRLFDDPVRKGSVVMQGLEEVNVRSKEEVYEILERGARKRATAATLLNAHSSRSHSVFSITVHIRETAVDGEEMLKTGKIYLVDLAGSENIGRSGAVDRRAREAGSINQSLLTLGRVITALVEHARHIPYRESKLTRLLQDSLGGRTKTSIIATISPSSGCLEETLSTLDYAYRAKNITNRPEVNQKVTKKALLKEYAEEIERLRRDLQAAREKHGFYMAQENYDSMVGKMTKQEELIKELEEKMAVVQQESSKGFALFAKSREEMEAMKLKLEKTVGKLQKARAKLVETGNNYVELVKARDENEFLLEEHQRKGTMLEDQAQELIGISEKAVQSIQLLHGKLDRTKKVQEINERTLAEYQENISLQVKALQESVHSFSAVQQEVGMEQNRRVETLVKNTETRVAAAKQSLLKLHDDFGSKMMAMASMLQAAKNDFQTQATEVMRRLDDAYEAVESEAKAIAATQRSSERLVTDHEDKSNEDLETVLTLTEQFVGCQFARDAPTGSTPSRQNTQYRIPRDLVRVSPREELLGRFREHYESPAYPIENSILEDTFNDEQHAGENGPM